MLPTADTSTPALSFCSPFARVLEPHLHTLPPVLRDHYLVAADSSYCIVLEGTMATIWHQPRWLRPMFALLAYADLLFAETGNNIPATMRVAGQCRADGAPAQTWHRTFSFAQQRRFNATMVYNARRGCVEEQLGPGQVLRMAWDVRFHPPATIEIVTTGCALQLGRWRVALPRLLYPSVRAVETVLVDQPDHIHIDLVMRHVWLGPIFGYNGTFALRREASGATP